MKRRDSLEYVQTFYRISTGAHRVESIELVLLFFGLTHAVKMLKAYGEV